MKNSKIAFTGATGFIGRFIADALPLPQIRLVRSSSLNNYNSMFPNPPPHTEVFIGNLQHHKDIQQFVANADILVHLACNNHPRSPKDTITNEWLNHFIPTATLFEIFASIRPHGHIIFASTGGNMYSDTLPLIPRTEEDVPHPRSFYALEKLSAEHSLRLLCQQYGISATTLRISNPYGTLLSSTRLHGLIGVAISCLLSGDTLKIIEPWETTRDYLHLEDLKTAFQAVINHPPKKGEFRLLNVSSGEGHSIKQVIEKLEKISGKSIQTQVEVPNKMTSPSWSVLSNKKIEESLNWKPTISFDQGLNSVYVHAEKLHLQRYVNA